MLKAPHLGLCMVIGSLMNAHCLVSLFSVSWLNPGLLISNLPYTFSFFLELAEWRDHSQGNCVLASKGVQCRLKLSLLDPMGKFDARLPREHFQQHLCEPPMQIAVFSMAALAVLQQSAAAAAAVARQHTVFHSSTLLGCWAEVSFSSHFISP